jgi:hypothetical protein
MTAVNFMVDRLLEMCEAGAIVMPPKDRPTKIRFNEKARRA